VQFSGRGRESTKRCINDGEHQLTTSQAAQFLSFIITPAHSII
jgi:hypothetical protein